MNPRLLPYIDHKRIALARTTLAIGVLYVQLALHAMHFCVYWTLTVVSVSAVTGVLSFFLFIDYGYFRSTPLYHCYSAAFPAGAGVHAYT